MTNNFCISMTSIPPRFSTLEKTLISIDQQKIKPKKIFLNIPKTFQRFSNFDYDFNILLKKFENLIINKCEDFGSGTKLLGSINEILNFDFVVLLDDDHVYNKQMLKIFNDQFNKNMSVSYSFCVYDIMDCKIGQGADGFLINTKYLKDIKKFYKKYVENNKKLFLNDDLWISIYLNKISKVDIVSVASFVKMPFFFKFKSIYKKHTQLGAIIETYSSNRKKARELKFKENCNEYVMLKNKTNNFKNI
jgi:hypothetical protein